MSRWVAVHCARQPLAWVLAGSLALLEPAASFLAPHGVAAQGEAAARAGLEALEVAFAAGLLGTAFAQRALAGWPGLWRPCGALRRLGHEAAGLLSGAALFQAPVLLALAASSGTAGVPAAGLARLALADLHLAGLSAVLLRIPAPPALGVGMLASFAWVLPMLFLADKGAVGFLSAAVGPWAPLRPETPSASAVLPAAAAPIAALWLAAGLLGNVRPAKR